MNLSLINAQLWYNKKWANTFIFDGHPSLRSFTILCVVSWLTTFHRALLIFFVVQWDEVQIYFPPCKDVLKLKRGANIGYWHAGKVRSSLVMNGKLFYLHSKHCQWHNGLIFVMFGTLRVKLRCEIKKGLERERCSTLLHYLGLYAKKSVKMRQNRPNGPK